MIHKRISTYFSLKKAALFIMVFIFSMKVIAQTDSITTHISKQYDKKSHWLIGENYRAVWNTDVTFPVFDIGSAKGGLTILKQGGGQQTKSLRLEAKDGRQYVLRSIEKYAEKAVPEMLRGTIAAELVQDQISASHPYGAFVIPHMATAAGVYHTNPIVVYVTDDPRLGEYRETFANSVCLFEERAAKDWSDQSSFGNSEKLISTPDLILELKEDNDNRVDQLWVVKSRLFDMFIGDWDRHDDQWRWARFDNPDKGEYYRPVPRDRDQAFFVSEGLLMNIISRKWAMPKFEGFMPDMRYVPGFNNNARYFDRDFMNEPSLDQWLAVADTLQSKLTDEVIEQAIAHWPKPVFEQNGNEVIAKLKSRRDNLKKYAEAHCLFLAETVSIEGSDKKEFFEINRIDDEHTEVKVFKKTKENSHDKLIYQRVFKSSETKEIRLYGFAGKDDFRIIGEVKSGPLVRIIGGEDDDEIKDKSRVAGLKKKNVIYDVVEGTELSTSRETKNRMRADTAVNNYDRKSFKYNLLAPLILADINKDDGVFIGGGFMYKNQGFRKAPFKSSHQFTGKFAFATQAFNFKYKGQFTDVVGKLDLGVNAVALAPNFKINYFGYGNESVFDKRVDHDDPIDYYRTRFEEYKLETVLIANLSNSATLAFGQELQIFELEDDDLNEDRFINDYAQATGDNSIFDNRLYEGLFARLEVDYRDNSVLPTKGVFAELDVRGYAGISDNTTNYASFNGSLSGFIPITKRTVLANRVGAGYNAGEFLFYQAQVLDGNSNLRGFRKTRFYGDGMMYHNIELRSMLFQFKNRIVPMLVGVNLFNDVGRVWAEGESSNKWHHGYGVGLWISPLNIVVLSVDVAYSEEDVLGYFKMGFRF